LKGDKDDNEDGQTEGRSGISNGEAGEPSAYGFYREARIAVDGGACA
jgi:hypothetical protein